MKKGLAILLAALMLLSVTAVLAEKTTYNVGYVQLVSHPALDLATQGFKDALVEKLGDAVTFEENVSATGDPSDVKLMADTLVSKNVDLIMANATGALQSAADATMDIPILATSITSYESALNITLDENGATGFNVSGTSDLAPLDEQAEMITALFPEAKKVGVLYCSAEPNSEYQVKEIRKFLEAKGIECTDYSFTDSNDIISVAEAAAATSDVIYIPTDNTAASNTEAIYNVLVPAGIPVIAGEESICAGCGLATLSISYYDIGYQTGLMAYEILVEGADVAQMPIRYAPEFKKMYNAEIAAELGVTLPDDYIAIGSEE